MLEVDVDAVLLRERFHFVLAAGSMVWIVEQHVSVSQPLVGDVGPFWSTTDISSCP